MIINHLTDTDFYTFTQAQAILHNYAKINVKYKFMCRNIGFTRFRGSDWIARIVNKIEPQIKHLCNLKLDTTELEYLSNIPYLSPDFIDHLSLLQLKQKYVHCYTDTKDRLCIDIEGPWLQTIWFEVPLLAIVSEIYSNESSVLSGHTRLDGVEILKYKIKNLKSSLSENERQCFRFFDFGTRRRYSYTHHNEVVSILKKEALPMFRGTSNVHFAMKHNLLPIGTMAHQWVMAHQQTGRVVDCQKNAFSAWANEFKGELGVALSDTLGFNQFIKDFDKRFANLFDGARQDSGDPYEKCNQFIIHLEKLGIDPKTKKFVFSDGLTFKVAIDLFKRFDNKIKTYFGIGTNLTNDAGIKASQIVIKMIECDNYPVAKICDSPGKGMCESEAFLNYVQSLL